MIRQGGRMTAHLEGALRSAQSAVTRLLADDVAHRRALDCIAALLDGQQWGPDTIDAIARIIRNTGRDADERGDA